MNGNPQLEAHYTNTGYPYVVDGFMGNYQDTTQAPQPQYAHDGAVHDQDVAYWSTNMSSYRYGLSSQPSTSYYGVYEAGHFLPHMDQGVRAWEYPTMMTIEDPITIDAPSETNRILTVDAIPDESAGSPNHQEGDISEVAWQDNIDLDGMTYEVLLCFGIAFILARVCLYLLENIKEYSGDDNCNTPSRNSEELLDLGEAIGTESRGLSEELISLLPTSKYKSGGLFSRKRSGERCVICQTRYKRGDRQISLPCKHVYHTDCGSKWLSINKTCPVCNAEVFGDESKQ